MPLLPRPPAHNDPRMWGMWFDAVYKVLSGIVGLVWSAIDFTGSRLSDIVTRPHSDLQNILPADDTSSDTTADRHISDAMALNWSAKLDTVAVDGVTITGDGTAGNPLVSAGGGVSLPSTNLISEQTLTSDQSSVTFSALDSTVDGDYTIEFSSSSVSAATDLHLLFGVDSGSIDSTLTNYKALFHQVYKLSETGADQDTKVYVNAPVCFYTQTQLARVDIAIVGGLVYYSGWSQRVDSSSGNIMETVAGRYLTTCTKLTSLSLRTSGGVTEIKAGSTFRLYGSNTNKQVAVLNIEGGNASTTYTSTQFYDGGGA